MTLERNGGKETGEVREILRPVKLKEKEGGSGEEMGAWPGTELPLHAVSAGFSLPKTISPARVMGFYFLQVWLWAA